MKKLHICCYIQHMSTRDELFSPINGRKYSITFDDVILMPGYINFPVNDVSLKTSIGNIDLNIPILSSPMDTVTEDKMAIKLALLGGMGIIHRNKKNMDDQVELVRHVKNFRNGFITRPKTLAPSNTVADVVDIRNKLGFSGIPITTDGRLGSKLVGLVSFRDVEGRDENTLLEQVMTPVESLITCSNTDDLTTVRQIMRDNKRGRIPIVDSEGNLVSLVCRKDMRNVHDHPNAALDSQERLRCGAAIGTRTEDQERARLLYDAGVDCICVDSSQGNSVYQLEMIRWLRSQFSNLAIIGGNVVTANQAYNLVAAGVDALRVGMGVGSICTTQSVCAVGRGQLSAIYDVKWNTSNIEIIADGGIRGSGDIIKALAVGADCVMLGSLLAGTEEAPGEYIYKNGRQQKCYRGMGSIEVLTEGRSQGCGDRYFANTSEIQVSQGVSGFVLNKGSINKHVPYLCQAIRHGFQDLGVKSISELHHDDGLRFEMCTMSSIKEGGVHDVMMTN